MQDIMKLLLFLTLLGAAFVQSELEIGDHCRTSSGTAGTCKDPTTGVCREWTSRQINDRKDVHICKYQGRTPIVCCSNVVVGGRLGFLSEETKRSKSYRKCLEYAEDLIDLDDIPVLLPHSIPSNNSECHIAKDGTQLIVGGTQAERYEFPHMALLGFGKRDNIEWKCGGSLISEKFILTAAHCIFDRRLGRVAWARMGSVFVNETNRDVQLRHIGHITPHPKYKGPAFYDDIALLELDDVINTTPSVRPACIHHLDGDTSQDVIASVTGWGSTYDGGPTSNVLMKAELKFIENAICRTKYTQFATSSRLERNIDDSIMICAGDPKGKQDTCQGDSGGPIQLVLAEPTCMYVIVGVTSFGPTKCSSGATPAVYTKVKSYIPWIESIVWADFH